MEKEEQFVGIFWVDVEDKQVYSIKFSLAEGLRRSFPNDEVVFLPLTHAQGWEKVRKRNSTWIGIYGYEVIPRGRVSWLRGKESFLVWLNPSLQPYESEILKEFNIGNASCRFEYSDVRFLTEQEQLEARRKMRRLR